MLYVTFQCLTNDALHGCDLGKCCLVITNASQHIYVLYLYSTRVIGNMHRHAKNEMLGKSVDNFSFLYTVYIYLH